MADNDATARIDAYLESVSDWRGDVMARVRKVVLAAVPGITEEWKWDTPGWSSNGMICSVGAFKDHVKVNFFKGASLPDPKGLFNAGLEAKASRGIDLRQGDALDESGVVELVKAAAAANASAKPAKASRR